MSFLSLPQEVVEEILILCALFHSPTSIACLAQTSRYFRDIIYDTTDNHLWREVYLTTFDDPRPSFDCVNTAIAKGPFQVEVGGDFDWRTRYQASIQLEKIFKKGIIAVNGVESEPNYLRDSFKALLSAIDTAHPRNPSPPEQISFKEFFQSGSRPSDSRNINWLTECVSTGFPPTLLQKLIGESPFKDTTPLSCLPGRLILHPSWDYSEAGQAFYKIAFQTGFRPLSGRELPSNSSIPSFPAHSDFKSLNKGEARILTSEKQRFLARAAARRRVYNLPFLSADRCWGPFLTLRTLEDSSKQGTRTHRYGIRTEVSELERLLGEDYHGADPEVGEIMNDFRLFFQELEGSIARYTLNEGFEADEDDEENAVDAAQVSASNNTNNSAGSSGSANASHNRDSDTDSHTVIHFDSSPDVDFSSNSSDSDITSSGRSSPYPQLHPDTESSNTVPAPIYPIHPEYPHLLQPDYAFLFAARNVVQINLLERFSATGSVPVWPWFTNEDAVHSTRTLLDSLNGLEGLDGLRMGSAPGFWDGINGEERRQGWGFSKSGSDLEGEPEPVPRSGLTKESFFKETKIDLDEERRKAKAKNPELELDDDGWDWAGIEGKWIRAACWMDYRDLLFLNLRATTYANEARSSSLSEDIQETCVVFPMDLIIIGYSHAKPPHALPSTAPSPSTEKGKGKGKASAQDQDIDSNEYKSRSSYNPLVYTLPIIHVTGKYSGTQHIIRVAQGTVRMIGDGAVRWSLITSDAGTGREEWVMEGVQIGGIGSALGVAGMWTGAQHERGDPLGPTWAWKIA
ncbi:hypothetical protein K435DRAFT_773301 [Dendrothele bispora CBS 962.96]|uniref:F-box domain-containing protein n=1 Tax=Dendrothele bispora (strain CBS 962.96) TaxID=1314807 RepID=A0A4S8MT49_DENBC|nr:hypothetical protein K435DRAFT_773301 [Dendrothele bispora CBS 962.96]